MNMFKIAKNARIETETVEGNGIESHRNIKQARQVEQIRNILFGGQMRDYETRFRRVEERLSREVAEVRDEFCKRLDSLEAFTKGEFESFAATLKAEGVSRAEAVEQLSRENGEVTRNLERKVVSIDEKTALELGKLREQLLEHAKSLRADIRDRHDQMKRAVELEATEIREAMAGRETLAEMLNEVALRLKNEFRRSDGE